MPSKFSTLLDKLDVDEKFNKRIQAPKSYNTVISMIPPIEDANMMSDILHLPETKNGNKYLFVIVDLYTKDFDIEPMQILDAEHSLKAMKACFKRDYIKKPKFSLKTDGGAEFKNIFDKYLYDNSILHKSIVGYRHKSMSVVESLNKQLARLFNGYMSTKEEKTGKIYRDWDNAVNTIRKDLNELISKRKPQDPRTYKYDDTIDHRTKISNETIVDKDGKKKIIQKKEVLRIPPKYKVGDMVYRALERPQTALMKYQPTTNFRSGDFTFEQIPRKITQIFTMSNENGGPLFRYYISGIRDASYSERELIKAPELYF